MMTYLLICETKACKSGIKFLLSGESFKHAFSSIIEFESLWLGSIGSIISFSSFQDLLGSQIFGVEEFIERKFSFSESLSFKVFINSFTTSFRQQFDGNILESFNNFVLSSWLFEPLTKERFLKISYSTNAYPQYSTIFPGKA